MQPGEQPVALCAHAGDVLLKDATLSQVTVVNRTDRFVPYVLVIVPSVYVKAAQIPWKQVLADFGTAVQQSGVLQQLGRLFVGRRKLP